MSASLLAPQVARLSVPTLQTITGAVAGNVRTIQAATGGPVMAVVKADGYGHGAAAVAHAAVSAGATWLGVTDVSEAVTLRHAGFTVPILAWLHPAGIDGPVAATYGIDVAVGSCEELRDLIVDVRDAGTPAVRVHLHMDTGMARGGAPVAEWAELLRVARFGQDQGSIRVVGVMGHLPHADRADPAGNAPAVRRMHAARDAVLRAGLGPVIVHLAATAGALTDPATHFDLVRAGAGLVGIDPSQTVGLYGASRFTAPIVHSASLDARTPVGYGGLHVTDGPTRVSVIGVGYADGIPRELSPAASVQILGQPFRIVGRVSMDQIVVDTGPHTFARGTVATIFGPEGDATPTIYDWARWAGTIPHTVVCGIGPRVQRSTL